MYAAQCGQVEIAKFICSPEFGADLQVKSYLSGRDALTISMESKFDKITDVINDAQKAQRKKEEMNF